MISPDNADVNMELKHKEDFHIQQLRHRDEDHELKRKEREVELKEREQKLKMNELEAERSNMTFLLMQTMMKNQDQLMELLHRKT